MNKSFEIKSIEYNEETNTVIVNALQLNTIDSITFNITLEKKE